MAPPTPSRRASLPPVGSCRIGGGEERGRDGGMDGATPKRTKMRFSRPESKLNHLHPHLTRPHLTAGRLAYSLADAQAGGAQ